MNQFRAESLVAQFNNVPDELKGLRIWAVHKSKVPFTASGEPAKSNDRDTWSTYPEVIAAFSTGSYDGIGIFMDKPYFCVDLDRCVEGKEISQQARGIAIHFRTYTERSLSKTGMHIIGKGVKPGDSCKFNKIPGMKEMEIYSHKRFLVMTGDHIAGTPRECAERQAELTRIYERAYELQSRQTATTNHRRDHVRTLARLSDEEVIELLESAKNGEKFKRLFYGGDMQDYGNDWSRADLGLCSMIAFYTQDKEQIERIFAQSALLRAKWENRDKYRNQTIDYAISRASEVYKAKRNPVGA